MERDSLEYEYVTYSGSSIGRGYTLSASLDSVQRDSWASSIAWGPVPTLPTPPKSPATTQKVTVASFPMPPDDTPRATNAVLEPKSGATQRIPSAPGPDKGKIKGQDAQPVDPATGAPDSDDEWDYIQFERDHPLGQAASLSQRNHPLPILSSSPTRMAKGTQGNWTFVPPSQQVKARSTPRIPPLRVTLSDVEEGGSTVPTESSTEIGPKLEREVIVTPGLALEFPVETEEVPTPPKLRCKVPKKRTRRKLHS